MAAVQALPPLCAINFGAMAEYLYNDLAEGVGAAARCLACRHPVYEHVAALAAVQVNTRQPLLQFPTLFCE